jgi:cytochrome c oxidase cbb3-type subunit III
MSSDGLHQDPLTDHEYDGIREYDNPTPGWWHALFFGTILFSIFYLAIFSWSPAGTTPEEDWLARQTEEDAKVFGAMGELEGDEATINRLRFDTKMMQVAKGMFQSTCASCHGPDGGGDPTSGVNLTDDHFKNVKALPDLFTVITNGAASGAMPPQRDLLTQNKRVLLAAYVASLRGTTPTRAKAAEGNVIAPWPPPPPPAAAQSAK